MYIILYIYSTIKKSNQSNLINIIINYKIESN